MARALLAQAPMRAMNKSSLGMATAKPAKIQQMMTHYYVKVTHLPVMVTITVRKASWNICLVHLRLSIFSALNNGGSMKSMGT